MVKTLTKVIEWIRNKTNFKKIVGNINLFENSIFLFN